MSIRIEQLHVESISRVFITRIELDGVITSRINEYINEYFNTGVGLRLDTIEEGKKSLSLKPATSDELGGIIVGKGLAIDADGILSTLPIFTYEAGESVTIIDNPDEEDKKIININRATKNSYGTIKLGTGLKQDISGNTIVDFDLIPKDIVNNHGLIKIGNGLSLENEITNVDTQYIVNQIKGTGLDIEDGKLSVNITNYNFEDESFQTDLTEDNNKLISLKPSSANRLGGIKVGNGLVIHADGTLHNAIDVARIENLENEIKNINRLYTDLAIELENLSKIVNDAQLGSSVHYYSNNFISGTSTFNGTSGINIKFRNKLTNLDYKVYLTATVATTGSLGEMWIENKTLDGFTIKTSGSLVNMQCDWLVYLNEDNTSNFDSTSFPFQKGTAELNQISGRYVPLNNTYDNTDYIIFTCASENPNGYYGEVWVEDKATNGFTLKTCGLSTTCDVDYIVIPKNQEIFNEQENPFIIGQGTFNSYEGTKINLNVELKSPTYQVLISPEENPEGHLGDIWVEEKKPASFVVRNTGSTNVKFNYLVIGK